MQDFHFKLVRPEGVIVHFRMQVLIKRCLQVVSGIPQGPRSQAVRFSEPTTIQSTVDGIKCINPALPHNKEYPRIPIV